MPDFDKSEFEKITLEEINAVVAKILPAVISNGLASMQIRISEGKGLDGGSMKPYSEGYKKQREKRGRQSSRRDLSMTGKMLGGIHLAGVKPHANGVRAEIGIAGARNREIALYHQRKTPWFGFTDSELREMQMDLKKRIERLQ